MSWDGYRLKFAYRDAVIEICVNKENATFTLASGESISFAVGEEKVTLDTKSRVYNARVEPLNANLLSKEQQ